MSFIHVIWCERISFHRLNNITFYIYTSFCLDLPVNGPSMYPENYTRKISYGKCSYVLRWNVSSSSHIHTVLGDCNIQILLILPFLMLCITFKVILTITFTMCKMIFHVLIWYFENSFMDQYLLYILRIPDSIYSVWVQWSTNSLSS